MQVFNKTKPHHDCGAGQPEKEQDLKKMNGNVSEEEHDAHSTVR